MEDQSEVGLVFVADKLLDLVAELTKSKVATLVGVILQLDGTFRLIKEGFPLLILVVQDAAGKHHEIGWCVCTSERASCVSRFVTVFRYALYKKCGVELAAPETGGGQTILMADGGYPLRLGATESWRHFPKMADCVDQGLEELLKVRDAPRGGAPRAPPLPPPAVLISVCRIRNFLTSLLCAHSRRKVLPVHPGLDKKAVRDEDVSDCESESGDEAPALRCVEIGESCSTG